MPPLPELLQYLHTLDQPYASSFDDRLLLALLLALGAGERNLVIRVEPAEGPLADSRGQRKEWVKRVADEVQWLCSAIFALTTHRVACSSKQPSAAFLKSLFLPSPDEGPNWRKDGPRARSQKRSSSAPLGVVVPGLAEARMLDGAEGRRPRSPGFLEPPHTSRRQQNASDSLFRPPSSAPASHLTFHEPPSPSLSPYSGPSPEAGDSSAGEDLYPSSLATSTNRRNTLSPKASRTDSPDRRRTGGRRHTLDAKDLLASAAGRLGEGLIGLGLDGEAGSSAASRLSPPRPTRPASPRRDTAGGGGYFNATHRSSARLPPSYIHQADRRPSIASIQSSFSASTATPPTPTAPRFMRSPPPSSDTHLSFPSVAPRATHVASPLSSPIVHVDSPPSSSPRAASPVPSRASGATHRPPAPSATYPPVTRAAPSTVGEVEKHLPQVLILEHLERARPSVQQTLPTVLRERRIVISASSSGGSGNARGGTSLGGPFRRAGVQGAGVGADDASSMRTRRTTWTVQTARDEGGSEGSWNLPEGFVCVAIVWDDEAKRREGDGGWGGVSRSLLDRFALSHTVPPSSLLSPSRFHAPPPPLAHPLSHALLAPLPLPPSALPQYLADTLDTYISDLLSALRHHPQVEGRMLTARAAREVVETVRVWVAIGKGGALRLSSPSEAGDAGGDGQCEKQVEAREEEERKGEHAAPLVLPQDVLSVLLAVLGHRLALRKPRNEKSLFWGSERGALEERRKGRKVENVVREVVAIV